MRLSGQLKSYVGLDASEAGKARDEYSKAVADRCKPRPAIEFEQFPCPEKPSRLLVAINVDPSLSLVGVEVTADKARENYGGEAFVFPIRSGTDARYLEPGQLPMFMTPQIRRVAVMASRIPPGTVVYFRNTGWRFEFLEVCEEENVLRFREPVTPKPRDVNLPLDRVLSVYQGADGEWMMVIETLH